MKKKIKTIDNKIEQNKAQYGVDTQAATISAISSGNVGKCEFLTGEEVLPGNKLFKKSATIKRFKYLPLSSVLKK